MSKHIMEVSLSPKFTKEHISFKLDDLLADAAAANCMPQEVQAEMKPYASKIKEVFSDWIDFVKNHNVKSFETQY